MNKDTTPMHKDTTPKPMTKIITMFFNYFEPIFFVSIFLILICVISVCSYFNLNQL